jgi:NTE family protein
MTTAFVFSGAGNRSALGVGVLRAMLEAGIKPDLIVGASAGAINALYLASHGAERPTVTDAMADLWAQTTAELVYPGNLVDVAWRFTTGAESLYSSDGMRQLVARALPDEVKTFGDLKIPLFTTAADLFTGRLFLFGDDPSGSPLLAVLAGATLPVLHPPVDYEQLYLVDGGMAPNLPVSVAILKGASEVYVLDGGVGPPMIYPAENVLGILAYTLHMFVTQRVRVEWIESEVASPVNLHYIAVDDFAGGSFRDFSRTPEMVTYGQEKASAYLAAPVPRRIHAPILTPLGAKIGAAQELRLLKQRIH